MLEDFLVNCCVEIQTPVRTPSSPIESPSEEINAAFEGSVEDLSPSATPVHAADAASHSQNHEREGKEVPQADVEMVAEAQSAKGKGKGHRTPSPKKLPHPGVVKKDGKGGRLATDTGHQLLITRNKDEERNVFTNPAMEVEWSNFVGQSSTDPDDKASTHNVSSLETSPASIKPSASDHRSSPRTAVEPTAMVMDRGGVTVGGGEDSAESTPDHSTQLLKSSAAVVVKEAEKEEVVYVVDDGAGSVSVSSKVVVSAFCQSQCLTPFAFIGLSFSPCTLNKNDSCDLDVPIVQSILVSIDAC